MVRALALRNERSDAPWPAHPFGRNNTGLIMEDPAPSRSPIGTGQTSTSNISRDPCWVCNKSALDLLMVETWSNTRSPLSPTPLLPIQLHCNSSPAFRASELPPSWTGLKIAVTGIGSLSRIEPLTLRLSELPPSWAGLKLQWSGTLSHLGRLGRVLGKDGYYDPWSLLEHHR